jgi:site-specific DNA recombinase
MQVPTWSDTHRHTSAHCNKKRGYGEWGGHMILKMLHNETYKGTWYYAQRKGKASKWRHNPREEWIPLEVPALVSEEIWERAQAQAAKNAFKARRNVKYEYLMRRKMTCKICGYSINAASVRTKKKLYKYYRCNSQANDLVQKCELPKFRAEQIDDAIWAWIRGLLMDPQALEAGLEAYRADREKGNAPIRLELITLEKLLREHRRKLDKLLDLYLADELPKEMLLERKTSLENIVSRLEAQRDELQSQLTNRILTDEDIQSILTFAQAISEEVQEKQDNFETRQWMVELFRVTATLSMEHGHKVLEAHCVLGPEKFVDSDDHFSKCGTSQIASTA